MTLLQATLVVKLGRRYAAYMINTLMPCMVLEMIGFLTHAFPIKDFSNRCTATLSCLIVKAAFFLQVGDGFLLCLRDDRKVQYCSTFYWLPVNVYTANPRLYGLIGGDEEGSLLMPKVS